MNINNYNKLERLVKYCHFFGDIHLSKKYLHIAGTKGKTSVSYYLSEILNTYGYNIGLFTSPHTFAETERIQYNNQPILEEDLACYKEKFYEAKQSLKIDVNFFEEYLIIALLYFHHKKIDYIVLEVGIGGRYDSTNFIDPTISIITRIQKDHQSILGKTLWNMFFQKTGIIKNHRPYIFGKQNFLISIFQFIFCLFHKNRILLKPYHIINIDKDSIHLNINNQTISLKGPLYMVENFVLAYSVLSYLNIPFKKNIFYHNILGRFQRITNKNIIFDGAHNTIAIKSLVSSLKQSFPNQSWKIILCIKKDKSIGKILDHLKPIALGFYLLRWEEYIGESFNPDSLIQELKKKKLFYKIINKDIFNNDLSKEDNILITGSFYHLRLMYEKITKVLI